MNRVTRTLGLSSTILMVIVAGVGCQADTETSVAITEARQESQILTTYALSRLIDAHDIKVTVDEGTATLTGKVSEDIKKELAQQIALGVNGIQEVDNQIEVDTDYVSSRPSEGRSYSDVVEDASTTAAVKSKLLWSKHSRGLSVNVETVSGTVSLLGTANSQEAKAMAGLLAANTHGVETVINSLSVEEAEETPVDNAKEEVAGAGQRLSDIWITTKVKSTLMYSSNIDGSDISVSTQEGVVQLSGKVGSDAEHALAVELTKNVRGVTRVDAQALSQS